MLVLDDTIFLLLDGYGWLPGLLRRSHGPVAHTRLLGRRAVGLRGPEAARFFYEDGNVRRGTALPEPVRSTLAGPGAVHTLDGACHRVRKAVFMSLLTGVGVGSLAAHTGAAWDEAAGTWGDGRRVVLFEQAAQVLTAGVCRWAGMPVCDAEVPDLAADLTAMVDGFGSAGPRHWRGRLARIRREAWLADLVGDLRDGTDTAPAGSALDVIVNCRDAGGRPLDARTAAVELLNIIRPTAAVAWYVTFAAHALHRWPEQRKALRDGDAAHTEAFAQEVRRFYPFAPFVIGVAARDLTWAGERIPEGTLVLLDVFGQNHDPELWAEPYTFNPGRFAGRELGPYELIPQGGGDPLTGHRCPGEDITLALLQTLAVRLARLDYDVPEQDLTISLRRIPTLPASGFVLTLPQPAPTQPSASSLHC